MAGTQEERNAALKRAIEDNAGQGATAQFQAVQQYLLSQPTQATTNALWHMLVRGLLILLGVDLLGILVMLGLGKFSDVLLTIFTTTLAGLMGVFVPSPKG
jgi:hypothetical protein